MPGEDLQGCVLGRFWGHVLSYINVFESNQCVYILFSLVCHQVLVHLLPYLVLILLSKFLCNLTFRQHNRLIQYIKLGRMVSGVRERV